MEGPWPCPKVISGVLRLCKAYGGFSLDTVLFVSEMVALSQSLSMLGNEAALVPCTQVGASPDATKVLKVSKCVLIAVESDTAQQCSGQEGEELACSSRVCEFLCPLQVVFCLWYCKSGLSSGDSDSLGSKQNRRVRFAIPPFPKCLWRFLFL